MIAGGENLVSSPPVFSADGKRLLVCSGRSVSIFSTTTGLLITELEGHKDRVTSVVVVPPATEFGKARDIMSYCWTSSLDCTIRYWDFAGAELIKTITVGSPIHCMVIPSLLAASAGNNHLKSNLFGFLSVRDASNPAGQNQALGGCIKIYSLSTPKFVGGTVAGTLKPESITVSKCGGFLGITKKRKIHIWSIPLKDFKPDRIRKVTLHHTKNMTSLAFHPRERIVAGGDVTGRILMWRAFGRKKFAELGGESLEIDREKPGVRDNDDADSCSTWHWHQSKLNFLHFSSDGAYLYSGGMEGVIVLWQLDTGKRRYKPRVGSPLLYFVESPDPYLSCVSCQSNQILLLKMPTMEVARSISGIKLPLTSDENVSPRCGFAFDPINGLVALRTDDYCMQFFSLFDNREVSQVQVCERNYHPTEEKSMYIALAEVSADSYFMCTVDVKLLEDELGSLTSLKFWSRGAHPGEYSLSTVIYEPHCDGMVSDVAFCPGKCMVASSSIGGDFKLWVCCLHPSSADQKNQKDGWTCQSVGSYKRRPMTAVAFSGDGSILAVAAETLITLWDPDTNALVAVIGEALSPIEKLLFVGASEYIVSLSRSSKPQVALWSAARLSLDWSYVLHAEDVCCSGSDDSFVLLARRSSSNDATKNTAQDGVLAVFNVASPLAIASWFVRKARGGGVAFVRHDRSLVLAYIDGDHEFTVFNPLSNGDNVEIAKIPRGAPDHEDASKTFSGGYAALYGDLSKLPEPREEAVEIPFVPMDRPWESVFGGSSHILPPPSRVSSMLFASLLEKRTPALV